MRERFYQAKKQAKDILRACHHEAVDEDDYPCNACLDRALDNYQEALADYWMEHQRDLMEVFIKVQLLRNRDAGSVQS
jgi:hypothetical protein